MREAPNREAEIRHALEACLQAPPFVRSPKLAAFLSFVVEEELAGRGEGIKAYAIATRALGRSEGFDPSIDPSVRVEAGRLRRVLDDTYAGFIRPDTVRIRVPTGGYRPVFVMRDRPEPEPNVVVGVPRLSPEATRPLFDSRGQAVVAGLLVLILLLLCVQIGLTLSLVR